MSWNIFASLWSPKIIQLSSENFTHYIRSKPYLLVNFYSPKCRYCKRFEPEYVKVAYTLQKKDSPVIVGKLDATVDSTIATEQGINRYPTIKLFKNSVSVKYDGPPEASKLIQWLDRRLSY